MKNYDEKQIYHWMVQDFLEHSVCVMPSEEDLDQFVALIQQLESKKQNALIIH